MQKHLGIVLLLIVLGSCKKKEIPDSRRDLDGYIYNIADSTLVTRTTFQIYQNPGNGNSILTNSFATDDKGWFTSVFNFKYSSDAFVTNPYVTNDTIKITAPNDNNHLGKIYVRMK